MDLKRDYEKLYDQWLEEFQQTNLTELNQELFNYYKGILNFINNYKQENSNELKYNLLKSYKDNINFLFNDFLKLREVKIINSALALKEINLNKVIETEKLLYQNLVSAIKGFKKVKSHSLLEQEIKGKGDGIDESQTVSKKIITEALLSNKKEELIVSESNKLSEKEKIDYTLVRFLKKTPPLVGIDLINYGPFKKEDIANLPQKNAKILIYEKFAEEIELT